LKRPPILCTPTPARSNKKQGNRLADPVVTGAWLAGLIEIMKINFYIVKIQRLWGVAVQFRGYLRTISLTLVGGHRRCPRRSTRKVSLAGYAGRTETVRVDHLTGEKGLARPYEPSEVLSG
jgi:hypothetical protein